MRREAPGHQRIDEVSEELSSGDESDDVSDVDSTETEILDISPGGIATFSRSTSFY
jgi:hypothetical protein